ncbi:MAG TPA: DegV family protein [Aggregatilineaceae bacterium]|nr:DegV family protein [Aggregatilineaceae bacterium]
MSKVRIVTDSSAHFLHPELIERYDIQVVPLTIQIGTQTFQEGVNLDAESFLRLASHGSPPAKVLPPSVEQFAAIYSKLNRQTDQILSLHPSRQIINQVWDHARTASKALLGRCEIATVDTLTISAGLAMLVENAARMADDGADLDEIVREVRGMLPRIYTVFYVETLDYLRHNGLLSEAQSILGGMLSIKPFLTIEEGELIPMEKVRTQTQAVDKLVEFIMEFASVEQLIILQNSSYANEQTRQLQDRLTAELGTKNFPMMTYGPSLAALIGPDGMGIAVYEGLEDEEEDED